jgi:hypothetical protein
VLERNEVWAGNGPDKVKLQGGLGSYIEFSAAIQTDPGGVPALEAEWPR